MAKVETTPYIFFRGDCKEGMEFYQSIFGGTLDVMPYEKAPQMPSSQDMSGKVMHAALYGGNIHLFGSDSPFPEKGTKVVLCLGGDDLEFLTDIFNKLGEGGKVTSPLKTEFWGDTFGTLTDKFNVDWMVNIAGKKAEA